jgi:hypothetical protein
MQRRMILPLTTVFLAAACSDVTTSPTSQSRPTGVPSLAIHGGGSPKFSNKDTDCTVSLASITCSYKITGLGNTDVVDIFLSAQVTVSGQCENHGGQIVEAKDYTLTVSGSQLQLRPENGQVTGSITLNASDAASPSVLEVCPNGNWSLINVTKAFVTDADLYAIIHHQDGSEIRIDSAF